MITKEIAPGRKSLGTQEPTINVKNQRLQRELHLIFRFEKISTSPPPAMQEEKNKNLTTKIGDNIF